MALHRVLKQVNAKVTGVEDVWMTDEVLHSFDSDLGPFVVSTNPWDVINTAPENQTAILRIAEVLGANVQFQNEVVDFEEYS